MSFDIRKVKPPNDKPFLAQIMTFGCMLDLTWYEVFFDSTIGDKDDFLVYDKDGIVIGEIAYWKHKE